MPYDPIKDAPAFRATLKKLTEIERLTSQAVVDMLIKARTPGTHMSISRATLDRFVAGEDITKIRELRAIHDLLRAHTAYGAYFAPTPAPAPGGGAPGNPDPFLASADPGAGATGVDVINAGFVGRFVMIRRDHDQLAGDDGVRVSTLDFEERDGGVGIEETQAYRTPDYEVPFEQTDRGQVFAHGPYCYFMMREVGGTCVKFGVIEQTLPELDRRQPVQYFQGHIMVVSRRGIFPRTRFAARRYGPNQHPVTSGVMRLGDIADQRALGHIRQDYVPGGMTATA